MASFLRCFGCAAPDSALTEAVPFDKRQSSTKIQACASAPRSTGPSRVFLEGQDLIAAGAAPGRKEERWEQLQKQQHQQQDDDGPDEEVTLPPSRALSRVSTLRGHRSVTHMRVEALTNSFSRRSNRIAPEAAAAAVAAAAAAGVPHGEAGTPAPAVLLGGAGASRRGSMGQGPEAGCEGGEARRQQLARDRAAAGVMFRATGSFTKRHGADPLAGALVGIRGAGSFSTAAGGGPVPAMFRASGSFSRRHTGPDADPLAGVLAAMGGHAHARALAQEPAPSNAAAAAAAAAADARQERRWKSFTAYRSPSVGRAARGSYTKGGSGGGAAAGRGNGGRSGDGESDPRVGEGMSDRRAVSFTRSVPSYTRRLQPGATSMKMLNVAAGLQGPGCQPEALCVPAGERGNAPAKHDDLHSGCMLPGTPGQQPDGPAARPSYDNAPRDDPSDDSGTDGGGGGDEADDSAEERTPAAGKGGGARRLSGGAGGGGSSRRRSGSPGPAAARMSGSGSGTAAWRSSGSRVSVSEDDGSDGGEDGDAGEDEGGPEELRVHARNPSAVWQEAKLRAPSRSILKKPSIAPHRDPVMGAAPRPEPHEGKPRAGDVGPSALGYGEGTTGAGAGDTGAPCKGAGGAAAAAAVAAAAVDAEPSRPGTPDHEA